MTQVLFRRTAGSLPPGGQRSAFKLASAGANGNTVGQSKALGIRKIPQIEKMIIETDNDVTYMYLSFWGAKIMYTLTKY